MDRDPAPDFDDPFDRVSQGAVRAALEAIVTVDEQQRIVMINPAAERMFGLDANQALGGPLGSLIPGRFRDAHQDHVLRFDRSGAGELPMNARQPIVGLRASGEEFPAEATISRIEVATESGRRRYYTALLRDLSAETSLGHEIEALKRRMRAFSDLAPVGIWVTEGETIVFANRACAALFGAADRRALVGRSIYSLLAQESHAAVRERVAAALASDETVTVVDERIARLDGSARDVEIAVARLPDHGHTAMQMVITDVTERRRTNAEVERSRLELRRLAASLVEAREEERRRIARELHDELGQRLTALKMELSTLTAPAAQQLGARIAATLEMVDETVAAVRRLATDLRPAMLDDLGLNAAIEWLARESRRRLGLEIELALDDEDPPLGDAACTALYRMVQEALTNVARHAAATRARIDMRCHGEELRLSVQDNGRGLSAQSVSREGSHGLMGMRERAYMLGGSFEVDNAPDGGARVIVRLPLNRQPPSTDGLGPAQTT